MPTPLETFMGYGWTAPQAAGVIGNGVAESGFNPAAVGDNGTAYGIFQLHPDRQANFQRVMGFPIQGSSTTDQLSFANWELRNTESRAGNLLAQQTTVGGAAATVMSAFERPANSSSLGRRVSAATNVLATGGSSLVNDAVAGAKAGAIAALDGLIPGAGEVLGVLGLGGDSCGIICQLKNWIASTGFFQRLALAFVALIILAAAFYMMKGNSIINTVKAVGKTAAVAA